MEGGRVADIEHCCFKIESELSKWLPEAHHVTMGCLPTNLLSPLIMFKRMSRTNDLKYKRNITLGNQEVLKVLVLYKVKKLQNIFLRILQPCYAKRLLYPFIVCLLYFQVNCRQKQL